MEVRAGLRQPLDRQPRPEGICPLSRAKISTNTVEGYFSIFKRGMKGVYQHCSEKHLHRYLAADFHFRYSNRSALGCEDMERADRMALGIVGKRLTYRRTNEAQA